GSTAPLVVRGAALSQRGEVLEIDLDERDGAGMLDFHAGTETPERQLGDLPLGAHERALADADPLAEVKPWRRGCGPARHHEAVPRVARGSERDIALAPCES